MKILIIQTAFIGDVILATSLLEKLHVRFPDASLDFLLRKGNESLFSGHPYLNRVLIWDKKTNKNRNLVKVIKEVRKTKYDKVINLQRFASSGLITFFSGAKEKIGFDKNPFSFCYTRKIKHIIGDGRHEVERNLELIASFADNHFVKPRLYPTAADFERVNDYKLAPYLCIAPASVWFTKQFPFHKWVEFLNTVSGYAIYLIGAPSDVDLCNQIITSSVNKNIVNLAGKLSFLQSAALMKDALMNYCNDSAPLHIVSSVNAPATAVFCSTIPAFGFGPLSSESFIVEIKEKLDCRPCGLHGYKACPLKHFKCAEMINVEQLVETLPAQNP
ncbi:MAG TPA: glycosyltransferase family 9 protein [Bacteroidia bacterium]|nr:glycosyltransferase family 9 protein [Bacteroidia bacterium]